MEKNSFTTEWGNIDYHYRKNNDYPSGLLLFMGSFIYKKYRGQGKFKQMVEELFSKFPEGTEVQLPIANKKLIPMFERMGFKKIENIEYWGKLHNTVNMKGYIYPDGENDNRARLRT